MLIKNQASRQIKDGIDRLWLEFDLDKNGMMNCKECRQLTTDILNSVFGKSSLMHVQFKSWFDRFDREHSGTIDKREFVAFLKKIIKNELHMEG